MARRIAIAEGGGCTSVMNDSLAGVIYEAQKKGYEVLGLRNGIEGGGLNPNISFNIVDLTNIDPYLLRGIPGAYLGTTRLKLNPDIIKEKDKISRIRKNLDGLRVEALFYIGGNDTAYTLMAEGKGIHIGKTIDNDLLENDHTPGYGSALLSNSELIRALIPDLNSFNPRVNNFLREMFSNASVIVYQTQGRDTGWLTIGSVIAKLNHAGDILIDSAPHVFLPREIPYDEEKLLSSVDGYLSRLGYCFIVCGEELVNKEGKVLSKIYGSEERKDGFGHTEHARSGAFNYADFVARTLKHGLNVDVEISNYHKIKETPIVPQHIQRTLKRSLVDAEEAFNAGREAVKAFDDGELNISIGLKRFGEGYFIQPVRIDLEKIAGKVRSVDDKYIGDINGPTRDFIDDFLPLVGGSLAMTHYNGPKLVDFKR